MGFRRVLEAGLVALGLALGAAAPALAAGEPVVGVRGWDHGDYGRLVFDLASGIEAKASVAGTDLAIEFSAPVALDAAAALKRLGRIAAAASLAADGRSLHVQLKQPAQATVQRYEDKLVVDLRLLTAPAPAATPEPAKPEAAKPVPPPASEASPAKPAAPPPAPLAVEPAKPVASPPPVPRPVTPEPPPAKPAAAVPAAAAPAPPPPALPPAAPGAKVTLHKGLVGPQVDIAFPAPVGATVFARAESLWFVFDGPGAAGPAITDGPLADLGTVEPLVVPGGSGFRLNGGRALPQVAADGATWSFTFGPDSRPPANPVVASPKADAQGRMSLVASVPGAHQPLTLTDPEIGDTVVAIPIATPGTGTAVGGRLPDLQVLATAQGMAFTPLADGVAATVAEGMVTIGRNGSGLMLSDVVAAPSARPLGFGQKADSGLDVGRWNEPGPVAETRARLQHDLALAPPEAKPDLRRALAEFYVVNGLGAEAIGEAALVEHDDATSAQAPAFRLMRGIALAIQERHDEALADLGLPALEFSPDAALWRAYALAGRGEKLPAHKEFGPGLPALGHYPLRLQERLLAAAGDAALAADDVRTADEASKALTGKAETAAGKALALALAGRVAMRRSDGPAARAAFEAALASGERLVRVDAEMGLVELGLADGSLSRAQAIEKLDRLRFAWRGDAKELAVLRRLADLELAEGRWRAGLETLRLALKVFPDAPDAQVLQDTQATAFRRLFLGGGADALPPVQAVALYFDFRDLTPLGQDGDEMIRRLADRLVQVDLFDQAKTLLTHQVTYRLQGIAKSKVASRLALIHLLDHDPAKALVVLDDSEQPVLPEGTAKLRRLLRARALADLGRVPEALAQLAGDGSTDAATLGAEITWQARDWPKAASFLGRLLDGKAPPPAGPPASGIESLVLRAAVALALAQDAPGLKNLADRWAAAMGQSKSADAFAMMTGASDPTALSTRNLAQTMANAANGGVAFIEELRRRLTAGELSLTD